MNKTRLLPLLGLVACGALYVGIVSRSHKQPAPNPVKNDKDRRQAPEFALNDANGRVVHLADYKGKVVLLDFWATWCGPCNIEIPWFKDFERKYKDRGFEVLGVSMDDEGWKAINPFVSLKKVNYRIVLGDDKTSELYGGIEALPTAFVIDRDGRIASVHVGLPGKEDFENAIEKLLETPAIQPDNNVRGKSHRADES
ncbi:MAG: TlpA family protein disulfide reductase [Acidobacteriota bacterium]|nr:TlpA family protein disulfide reductase [Acidobacteriota bacterium]